MSDGVVVIARPGEPLEKFLRRFSRAFQKSGLPADLRARRWHLTRSERRRVKARHAARRRERARKRLEARAKRNGRHPR